MVCKLCRDRSWSQLRGRLEEFFKVVARELKSKLLKRIKSIAIIMTQFTLASPHNLKNVSIFKIILFSSETAKTIKT